MKPSEVYSKLQKIAKTSAVEKYATRNGRDTAMDIKDIYLSAQDFLEGSYKGLYSETVEPNNLELSIQTDDFMITISYDDNKDKCLSYVQRYRDGHGYYITLEAGWLTEKGIEEVSKELIVHLKRALYGQNIVAPGKHVDLVSQLGEAKAKIKDLEKQLDSLRVHNQASNEQDKDDEVLNRLVKEAYEKVLKSIKASTNSFNSKPVDIKLKVETTYSDE
jgi:hypothetical protein